MSNQRRKIKIFVNEKMEVENSMKNESNETILISEEDGIHYSDFENAEYEEVGEDFCSKPDNEYSYTSLKNFHRKRTRNFSQNECNLICTILQDYYDIVENKRNDHKTNFLKNKAWSEITQKFNDNTKDEYRTALQLRTFYENLKKKRKKLLLENGETVESTNPQVEKTPPSEAAPQHKLFLSENKPDSFRRHNLVEEYHQKRIELVDKEIEKVKAACEQQHRIFILQEEKLLLEIQEIKERLKK